MNMFPFPFSVPLSKDQKGSSFSFIFLSLVLLILCFFIKIISLSNFERIKVDAVTTSVQSAFHISRSKLSFFRPSFIPAGPVLMSQELFMQFSDTAKIHQNWDGKSLSVTLEQKDIFEPFQDTLTPKAKIFFRNMAYFLRKYINRPYEISLTHYIDLPIDGIYPIYSSLASRRAQKIASYWVNLNIPKESIHVGFQKGNIQNLSIFLTFPTMEEQNVDQQLK